MKPMNQHKKSHKPLTALAIGIGAAMTWRALLRNKRALDVRDKVVLIVGGSRGFGLVIARQLADEGAHIALCARGETELAKAKSELEARGAHVWTAICDVTNKEQVYDVTQRAHAHFGALDVVICCAGHFIAGPLEAMTEDDFEYSMRVNFWGAYHATMAALPFLKGRGGRVVHISSVGGRVASPHLLPYNASKFALSGLSQGLRVELEKDDVLVTTVYPWVMRVGSLRNAEFKGQHRKEYALGAIMNSNPLASDSPERAAAQLIAAMKRGDASLSLHYTKPAVLVDTILPEISKDIMCIANRLMPKIDGEGSIGTEKRKGHESESKLAPSRWTARLDAESVKNNEMLDAK